MLTPYTNPCLLCGLMSMKPFSFSVSCYLHVVFAQGFESIETMTCHPGFIGFGVGGVRVVMCVCFIMAWLVLYSISCSCFPLYCLPFNTLIAGTFAFSLSLLLFFLPFGFEKIITKWFISPWPLWEHGVESSCRGRFMHCVDYLIHMSGKRQSAEFIDVTSALVKRNEILYQDIPK